MTAVTKFTFCRICESLCGLEATVENGRILDLKADRSHPISQGLACPKGPASRHVQDDPDRVLYPLRRNSAGEFERVSWEVAIKEIAGRIRELRSAHGNDSIGFYLGNPSAYSAAFIWVIGMAAALGTKNFFSAGSQDTASKFAAAHFMYGSPVMVSVPDIPRTDYLLILGANPLVSHGSLVSGGFVRQDLKDLVARGGRVVVVDPRRTETAKQFEHVAVKPDSDAWLLLSMLHVIFAEGLQDRAAVANAEGGDRLAALVAEFNPEATQARTGVSPEQVRELARDLATAPSAAAYGRTGACLGSSSTLVNFLLEALSLVTGNLDVPGGMLFPVGPVDLAGLAMKQKADTYGTFRTRIGNLPEVVGQMPAAVLADEITTPGPGQVRALLVWAGNPVLSAPDSGRLSEALDHLDLHVAVDFYANETNSRADYILPATTFLEREDLNLFVMSYQYRKFVQWTDAVVPPAGEAREEWTIVRDLCAELGLVPSSAPAVRRLGRLGRAITPRVMLDGLVRTGSAGDRFGLRRGGLSRKRLLREPHGVLLPDEPATGVLRKRIKTSDRRVQAAPPEIAAEIRRLATRPGPDSHFPLVLFGRRELRSINSWMHNVDSLNPRQQTPPLLMHPEDAASGGIRDGEDVEIRSATGRVTAAVRVDDAVIRGSVSLPHGWGHDGRGGWQRANAAGGANYNLLVPSGPETVEPLAGMTILNGLPVRVDPVRARTTEATTHA